MNMLPSIPYTYLLCQAYTYPDVYRNDFTSVGCGNLDCESGSYFDPSHTLYGVGVSYCLVASNPGAGVLGGHEEIHKKYLHYMYEFII